MLKANNLTISVPYYGCNKNCPYCISKLTGYVEKNEERILRNINKVKKVANTADVSSVLITGKGEPLFDKSLTYTRMFIDQFRGYPLELQTNGLYILYYPKETLSELYYTGLDIIALSFDELKDFQKFKDVIPKIKENFILRISFNITSKFASNSFNDILNYCKIYGIDQLTLKKVTSVNVPLDHSVSKWIEENAGDKYYTPIINEAIERVNKNGTFLRSTNFGTYIYDLEGISFSHSEYCIQEKNNSTDIRSLIFLEDGHLYTSWNSKASILF